MKAKPSQKRPSKSPSTPFVKTWPLPDGFFTTGILAGALQVSRQEVLTLARRERWPSRKIASELEFKPDARVAIQCASYLAQAKPAVPPPTVTLSDLVLDPRDVGLLRRAIGRHHVVRLYLETRESQPQLKSKAILQRIRRMIDDREFQLDIIGGPMPAIGMSNARLVEWVKRYRAYGFTGLLELKRGRVGRRAKARGVKPPSAMETTGVEPMNLHTQNPQHFVCVGGPQNLNDALALLDANMAAQVRVAERITREIKQPTPPPPALDVKGFFEDLDRLKALLDGNKNSAPVEAN